MDRAPVRVPEKRRARIGDLAVLPVFLPLTGKRVVLAGGGEAAVWKAELLAATGARLDLYAATPCDDLVLLAREKTAITLHRRPWSIDVFAGAALAVGAIEENAEAEAFRCAARSAGVLVNIVDRPELCDFQFGGVVNRSPLVIGVSTHGAAPVFGQAIRARIEAVLPAGLSRWAEAARAVRPLVQAKRLAFGLRRAFWERFSERALAAPDAAPDAGAIAALIEETVSGAPRAGSVALVGAGPGDPELLTLKAVRLLQSADVIVHDDLVPDAVLDMARREATRIAAGKRGHGPSCRQEDVNALLVRLAREGKRVVRLKAGDPLLFGRAGEEIAACRAAGVPVEIAPGVSSPQGAAASLAVSLTHRDHARRLQFVTAHGASGALPEDLCWEALVDPAASTAIYMGRRTWADLAAGLLARGMDASTPAIAVANATRADQRTMAATVATLGAALDADGSTDPVVILVGAAFRSALATGAEAQTSGAAALPERAAAAPIRR